MNNIINYKKIINKTEFVLNEKVTLAEQYENVPNNYVYKIDTKTGAYIFKEYKSSSWPENGKTVFIDNKLNEYGIPHAKLIAFSRDDADFPNGFLIEKRLNGVTADRVNLSLNEEILLYKRLAELVSKVHQIPITNYGYIGSGTACCSTFTEFIEDSYIYHVDNLLKQGIFNEKELSHIKETLIRNFQILNKQQPVLNHGDLSKKNIILGPDGNITLIDWDDAVSLCWYADITRLTIWMNLNYDVKTVEILLDSFFSNYTPAYGDIETYAKLENALNVWYSLDYLNYFFGTPQYEMLLPFFNKALNKL